MNLIKLRREYNCICSKCKSPDYNYVGRNEIGEKHEFECNSCGNFWQYGKTDSNYLKLTSEFINDDSKKLI